MTAAGPTLFEALTKHREDLAAKSGKCKVGAILDAQPGDVQEAMNEALADTETFSAAALLSIFRSTVAPIGDNLFRAHRAKTCGCFL